MPLSPSHVLSMASQSSIVNQFCSSLSGCMRKTVRSQPVPGPAKHRLLLVLCQVVDVLFERKTGASYRLAWPSEQKICAFSPPQPYSLDDIDSDPTFRGLTIRTKHLDSLRTIISLQRSPARVTLQPTACGFILSSQMYDDITSREHFLDCCGR